MADQEVQYQRQQCHQFTNMSEKFQLPQRDFNRQYFHLYSRRLEAMRPRVVANAKLMFPNVNVLPLCRLNTAPQGEDVLIVGTLFKNQSLKPNILQELCDENAILPQPAHKRYISEDDDLILEDDLQRIKLRGPNVQVSQLVSGIVCGVLGQEKESGKFEVKQIFFAKPPAQPEKPLLEPQRSIVFLSGLELADPSSPCLLHFQLAIDYLIGDVGDPDDQETVSKIERVIIGGNSLSESTRDKEELSKAKYLTKDAQAGSIGAINLLDKFLVQLAGSVQVDIMPGAFDPSSHVLPQQPLHPCLFPLASAFPTLKTVSNPFALNIDGLHLFGTSGQNTDDIIRNTDLSSSLDASELMIRCSHYAPTSPDTLGCFPYKDKDPFIMDSLPHVLFTSNQEKFEQKTMTVDEKTVKLLAVPKFADSFSIVKLDLASLEAEEICFDANIHVDRNG